MQYHVAAVVCMSVLGAVLLSLGLAWVGYATAGKRLERHHRVLGILVFMCWALVGFSFINWTAWAIGSDRIGGSALGTVVEDGRYYIQAKGVETDVSREVWLYSHYHSWCAMTTAPLGFLAILCLLVIQVITKKARIMRLVVAADGTITVDGQAMSLKAILARAAERDSQDPALHITQEYPADAVPDQAVRLYSELMAHGIRFETVKQA